MRSARSRSKIKKDSAFLQRFRGFSPDTGDDGARSRAFPGASGQAALGRPGPADGSEARLPERAQRGQGGGERLRVERRQERGEAAGTGQSEAGGSTMAPQRAVTGNRPQAASGNGQQRRRKRAAPTQGTAQQRTKGAAPYEEYGAGYTATSTSGGGAAGLRRCRAAIRPQAAAPGRTTVRRRTAGRTSAGRWPW